MSAPDSANQVTSLLQGVSQTWIGRDAWNPAPQKAAGPSLQLSKWHDLARDLALEFIWGPDLHLLWQHLWPWMGVWLVKVAHVIGDPQACQPGGPWVWSCHWPYCADRETEAQEKVQSKSWVEKPRGESRPGAPARSSLVTASLWGRWWKCLNLRAAYVSMNPPVSAGDVGSIPGLGRSAGEGSGNPPQYSCLENPTDRGAWRATVHVVAKSWTWLSDWTTTACVGEASEMSVVVSGIFQLCQEEIHCLWRTESKCPWPLRKQTQAWLKDSLKFCISRYQSLWSVSWAWDKASRPPWSSIHSPVSPARNLWNLFSRRESWIQWPSSGLNQDHCSQLYRHTFSFF